MECSRCKFQLAIFLNMEIITSAFTFKRTNFTIRISTALTLLYNESQRVSMAANGIPVRNPGRYLEQFVKIVRPKSVDCLQTSNPAIQFSHLTSSPNTQWWRQNKEVYKKEATRVSSINQIGSSWAL